MEVLSRDLDATRLGELPYEAFHEVALVWQRNPELTHIAPRAFLNAARRGSPNSLCELGLSLLRTDEGLVRDPALGERILISMIGLGHGPSALGLGWSYRQRLPPGADRRELVELQLAAFVVARELGDPQATSPLRGLARTNTIPTPSQAWRRLRQRGAQLSQAALSPATRRGPPISFPAVEARALVRRTLGALLTRSHELSWFHELALDETPNPSPPKETVTGLLRGAIRGEAKVVWRLGLDLATSEKPVRRPAGRLLLVTAIACGRRQEFGPLAKSYHIDGLEEIAIGCMTLGAASREDKLWLDSRSKVTERPSPARAWELFWTGFELDRATLGLGAAAGGRPLVEFPDRAGDLLRAPDAFAQRKVVQRLWSRYPALRALLREAGHEELHRLPPAAFAERVAALKARGDGLGMATLSAYRSRSGVAAQLNALSHALSNRTNPIQDPDLALVVLYASASAGGARAWTHLSRIHARLGDESLQHAALTISASLGDEDSRRRLATFSRLGAELPTLEFALALHRAALAERLARPLLGVETWALLRKSPLPEDEQRARARRLGRMVALRSVELDRGWRRVSGGPPDLMLRRANASEARRPGAGADLFLRSLIEHGDLRAIPKLAFSLATTRDSHRVALAWALLYSRLDLDPRGEILATLAKAAGSSRNGSLARSLARLAIGDPTYKDEAGLRKWIGGGTLPEPAEALRDVALDRERAFLAAGFPSVGKTPPHVVPGR